jgi:hypothetical protein
LGDFTEGVAVISDAIGKAPAPIKAGLFLYEQAGGILQVGIAAGTDNQGRETAEFVGSLIGLCAGIVFKDEQCTCFNMIWIVFVFWI